MNSRPKAYESSALPLSYSGVPSIRIASTGRFLPPLFSCALYASKAIHAADKACGRLNLTEFRTRLADVTVPFFAVKGFVPRKELCSRGVSGTEFVACSLGCLRRMARGFSGAIVVIQIFRNLRN